MAKKAETAADKTRPYLKQSDVPKRTLKVALRVPTAIKEQCGGQPTPPLIVGKAMNLTPTGGNFHEICGASIAYGLTEGGAKATRIKLTALGDSIVSATGSERKRLVQQAVLKPTAVGSFLRKYHGNRVPSEDVAVNLLQEELGMSAKGAKSLFQLIIANAEMAGFLQLINEQSYVHVEVTDVERPESDEDESDVDDDPLSEGHDTEIVEPSATTETQEEAPQNRDVFITHGSNRKIVEQIKELLEYADLNPVVAVEQETAAIPIPYKIGGGMRDCIAAIIHVGTEMKLRDDDGTEHIVLNSNVLIEIGAAMALYQDNFILLVEEGVDLPSNLQGLAVITFRGDELDYRAAVRVLKTLKTL